MVFRKKGKLRQEFDDILISQLEQAKEEWSRQKRIVEKSLDPSDEILHDLKILEARYLYLLRQAKIRHVSISKNK